MKENVKRPVIFIMGLVGIAFIISGYVRGFMDNPSLILSSIYGSVVLMALFVLSVSVCIITKKSKRTTILVGALVSVLIFGVQGIMNVYYAVNIPRYLDVHIDIFEEIIQNPDFRIMIGLILCLFSWLQLFRKENTI